MGCGLSKQKEEDDVVLLCKERKKLLKLAVEKRYAFADSQFKYNQSLYSVAMALRLFVARHSSPISPFLITFNDNLNESCVLGSTNDEKCDNVEKKMVENESESGSESDSEGLCEHFYSENGLHEEYVPSPDEGFGWDFFYSYDEMRSYNRSFNDDLRVVREKEGIPELEEVVSKDLTGKIGEISDMKLKNGEFVVQEMNGKKNDEFGSKKNEVSTNVGNGGSENPSQKENAGLKVIDNPTNGRELLEALKDIEDHFLRCYESGLDISRMLEANRVPLQSGLEEIKESSNKLIRSITWHRSPSSRSFSSKSVLSSASTNSSVWTDFKAELLFDDFGMEAGSHSLTLGRLYAWEKKLYEEVKAGDRTRKMFERKCSRLRLPDASRERFFSLNKSEYEVKELHSRITVAIRSVESISDRIEKLRDEELQPQLIELLQGLMRNWTMMLESHEMQNRVMLEVKFFNCPAYGKFSNDSHRLATLQLEAELDNWRNCFATYVSTQKAYIKALSGWLSKFIPPEVELYSNGKYSLPSRTSGLPLLVTCRGWLAWMDKLPDYAVTYAMKNFGKDIHALWSQQGKEQQLKRKVDGLAKELERRTLGFHRSERRILKSKISEHETQAGVRNRIEYLAEGKNLLDMFKRRLDEEKGKHQNSLQETQQITVSGFQTGFSSVFESLTEFSKASVKMYADLITYNANTKTVEKIDSNLSYLDGMFS